MAIVTTVNDDRTLTLLTVIGEVSFDEMKEAIEGFWRSPELTLNVLWDYSRADMRNISRSKQETLVRLGRKFAHRLAERSGGKAAIIAPRHLEFAMNRASETLSQMQGYPFEVRTFRTAEEATAWLAEGDDGR